MMSYMGDRWGRAAAPACPAGQWFHTTGPKQTSSPQSPLLTWHECVACSSHICTSSVCVYVCITNWGNLNPQASELQLYVPVFSPVTSKSASCRRPEPPPLRLCPLKTAAQSSDHTSVSRLQFNLPGVTFTKLKETSPDCSPLKEKLEGILNTAKKKISICINPSADEARVI